MGRWVKNIEQNDLFCKGGIGIVGAEVVIDYELGQVIAERKLSIKGDPSAQVRVLMGAPQRKAESNSEYYVCPVQILGFGDERVRGAHGVDAFQALKLGMELIGVELYVKLNKKCNGKLRWNDEEDLAFPLPESVAEFGPGRLGNP